MKVKVSKIFKFLPIIFIIWMIVFSIPVRREENWYGDAYSYYNIVGFYIGYDFGKGFHYTFDFFDMLFGFYPWPLVLPAWFLIIWLITMLVVKHNIKCCSLQLTTDGVSGNRKKLFSNKMLKLPIEKVDSILIENRIIDKILGGHAVAIRTASGLVRFICVQNAEEFVNKTLETIKAYKESSKSVTENVQKNSGDDSLEKITKLKEMLDNGIITQEEFDAKKKQLLGL